MHPLLIFDDGRGQLGPMTDLRASFEVRTGMFTTAGRLAAHRPRTLAGYAVPARLEALVRQRADAPVNALPGDELLYCVNGRWALPDPDLDLAAGEALCEADSGDVVAAVLRRADAEYFFTTGRLSERIRCRLHEQRLLYRYPWDVIALFQQTIPHDICSTRVLDAQLPDSGAMVVGDHPVEVHATARIYPGVVLDAERGPIIIHERAVVRPNAVLCGPCSVGRESIITDRALIKANTVIGRACKVGGEVGATIFQGYANKAHDGHLGDSWVGKWVNIGAGTSNSNLLNTYGEVLMRVSPHDRLHRTGMTFLGAILGDHVKLAINTSITTGSVIGTGALIALCGPPPAAVRRFAWLTDSGEQTFRCEKLIETAKAMMARRSCVPSDAYLAVLRELHEQHTVPAARHA